MPKQVLQIEPEYELKFKGLITECITSRLKLANPSDKRVCFKIQTTVPKRYCVRPNAGILEPSESISIAVVHQPCRLERSVNNHKFMVLSLYAPDGEWKDANSTELMDTKLRCVYEEISMDGTSQNDLTVVQAEKQDDASVFKFHMKLGFLGEDISAAEASFLRDVTLMYNAEENYSDLMLQTKDHMKLSTHRFILAARSPVLRKWINERIKQKGFTGTIKVPTVNAKPLAVILHWMYTGELLDDAVEVMDEVVEACTLLEIPTLLKILDIKLISICNTENMFLLFQVAKKNDMSIAKNQIADFIAENIRTA